MTAALENAAPFPTPDYAFADIVGTGGDGHNTINISTASAIVAATMGYKVAKHGSRSVSSKTGASDVLSQLGINIQVPAETARKALDEIGICFFIRSALSLRFQICHPRPSSIKNPYAI